MRTPCTIPLMRTTGRIEIRQAWAIAAPQIVAGPTKYRTSCPTPDRDEDGLERNLALVANHSVEYHYKAPALYQWESPPKVFRNAEATLEPATEQGASADMLATRCRRQLLIIEGATTVQALVSRRLNTTYRSWLPQPANAHNLRTDRDFQGQPVTVLISSALAPLNRSFSGRF